MNDSVTNSPSDTVPVLITNESVLPRSFADKYKGLEMLHAINDAINDAMNDNTVNYEQAVGRTKRSKCQCQCQCQGCGSDRPFLTVLVMSEPLPLLGVVPLAALGLCLDCGQVQGDWPLPYLEELQPRTGG